jgi:hypothetical protein
MAGAVLAALVATPAVALAQTATPSCEVATRTVVDLQAALKANATQLDTAKFLLSQAVDSAKPYFQGEVVKLEGVAAKLNLDIAAGILVRDRVCAPPATTTTAPPPTTTPTTTTVPPTTTGRPSTTSPAPSTTTIPDGPIVVPSEDDDDSGSFPEVAPETGGYEN